MTDGGIGRTHTERVVLFTADDPLVLESGRTLAPVEVAYETYGTLNAERSNVVFVCHALTGDAHAAGHHGDPARRGWWDNAVGSGRAIDTDRFFVVCPNLLGGCQGTTGPSSIEADTGQAYGLRFPLFTVRDLVGVHRALLRHLGISRVRAAVGGSLGAMQALQWALDTPGELDQAILACVSAKMSAQNIAFSTVARAAIMGDANFAAGDYARHGVRPDHGLAVARMMAHITYLSEEAMRRKFDRARRDADIGMTFAADFEVEHYLDHQAETFLARFDALSYLYLVRTMDYFEPFADPALDLNNVTTRFLILSFDSDWRFGTAHSRYVASTLGAAGVAAEHVEVSTPWGHDSFLLDIPAYHDQVARFLAGDGAPARRTAARSRARR
jgi:homoserine O-acetyltransferase